MLSPLPSFSPAVISLGTTSSMNLELSLPLIWLVYFLHQPGYLSYTFPLSAAAGFTAFLPTPTFCFWSIIPSHRPHRRYTLIFFAALSIYQLSQSKSVVKYNNKTHLAQVFISSCNLSLVLKPAILDRSSISRPHSHAKAAPIGLRFSTSQRLRRRTSIYGQPPPRPLSLALYLYFCKDPKHPKLLAFAALLSSLPFFTFSRGAIFPFSSPYCYRNHLHA